MRDTFKGDLIVAYSTVLGRKPTVETTEMNDRNGEPCTALVVDGGFYVYPVKEMRQSIGRKVEGTKIAIDRATGPNFWTGDPQEGVPDYVEMACVQADDEAIALIVAESAREDAYNALAVEGMARECGEGSSDAPTE